MLTLPTEGGSYIRDPETGELTRQSDAPPAETPPVETLKPTPKPQEPAKKGSK